MTEETRAKLKKWHLVICIMGFLLIGALVSSYTKAHHECHVQGEVLNFKLIEQQTELNRLDKVADNIEKKVTGEVAQIEAKTISSNDAVAVLDALHERYFGSGDKSLSEER